MLIARQLCGTLSVAPWFALYCKLVDQSREARMKTVGAFQAKTQLSQLLDEVEKGEAVTITRHGRPVAVLAPVESARPAKTGEEWLAEVKRLRKGITLGGTVTIRQLIDEGRKY
jgi:prevent-host-death family protein